MLAKRSHWHYARQAAALIPLEAYQGSTAVPNGQRPAEQNGNITENMGFPDAKE